METIVKKEVKEVIIELDNTLEFKELRETDVENFNKSIISKSTKSGLEMVRDCIEGEHRHLGYLEYLRTAWNNHIGIIFTPDIFWQLFLTEVAGHIKDNAETYRELFTDSDDKKEIIVLTADPQLIDLRLISEELLKLTPTNTEMFLPEFTTTTFEASMAFKAAFADAMSPYYSYSMMLCGIPKVKLLGEEKDWDQVISNVEAFGEIIALPDYFQKITELANNIKSNVSTPDAGFWKDMFCLERCGSGGQTQVSGWVKDFYIKTPRPGYIQNYPSAVSFVSYKLLDTGQKFELCYGLFSSNIEDGYMIPQFGYIINEEK